MQLLPEAFVRGHLGDCQTYVGLPTCERMFTSDRGL